MPPVNEELITEAIFAHRNGLSLHKDSEAYGVNRRTVTNRLIGLQTKSQAYIDTQRLSPIQEDRLATWIVGQEVLGYVPSHVQIRMIASRLLAIQGDTTSIGELVIYLLIY